MVVGLAQSMKPKPVSFMRTPSGRAVLKVKPTRYDTHSKAIQTATGCTMFGEFPVYGRWEYTVQLGFSFKTHEAMVKFHDTLPDYFLFSGLSFCIWQREECREVNLWKELKKPYLLLITGKAETLKQHTLRG